MAPLQNERSSCAAAQLPRCAAKAFYFFNFCSRRTSRLSRLTINSMQFRTGLVKGPIRLEYGSIKKVEVAASTFVSNSSVLEWFFAAYIQSMHFCDTWRSQQAGNFPSFRNVEAATSTFPLWMSQNFYFPVSLLRLQ